MPDQVGDEVAKVRRAHPEFMVLRSKSLGCHSRVIKFVGLLFFSAALISDTEGFDSFSSSDLAHHGEDGGRIETAAEKYSQRDLGNEPQPDAFLQEVLE